jgi:cellulose synthase/poly-beta-1,6-N-acetylglucosamine synthase-like glycosyltransferase
MDEEEGVDSTAMSKELTLVLPAYNEAGNIERVVASFLDIRDRIDFELKILIVNDGSSDATGPICRNLAENNPSLRCVQHGRNIVYWGAFSTEGAARGSAGGSECFSGCSSAWRGSR